MPVKEVFSGADNFYAEPEIRHQSSITSVDYIINEKELFDKQACI